MQIQVFISGMYNNIITFVSGDGVDSGFMMDLPKTRYSNTKDVGWTLGLVKNVGVIILTH